MLTFWKAPALVKKGARHWFGAISADQFEDTAAVKSEFRRCTFHRSAGQFGPFGEGRMTASRSQASCQAAGGIIVRSVPKSAMTYPRLLQGLALRGPVLL